MGIGPVVGRGGMGGSIHEGKDHGLNMAADQLGLTKGTRARENLGNRRQSGTEAQTQLLRPATTQTWSTATPHSSLSDFLSMLAATSQNCPAWCGIDKTPGTEAETKLPEADDTGVGIERLALSTPSQNWAKDSFCS